MGNGLSECCTSRAARFLLLFGDDYSPRLIFRWAGVGHSSTTLLRPAVPDPRVCGQSLYSLPRRPLAPNLAGRIRSCEFSLASP